MDRFEFSWDRVVLAGWIASAATHCLITFCMFGMMMPAPSGGSKPIELDGTYEVAQRDEAVFEILPPSSDEEPSDASEPGEQEILLEFEELGIETDTGVDVQLDAGIETEIDVALELPSAAESWLQTSVVDGQDEVVEGPEESPEEESGRKAEFFGTVAHGFHFVYVLDKSGSMDTTDGDKSRYQQAADELMASVNGLTKDQFFYVVLFSDGMVRMFDDKSFVPQAAPATETNKKRLDKWLRSITPGGGTDPRKALRLALSLKPSAIFLLSDGEFNGDVEEGFFKGAIKSRTESGVVSHYNRQQTPIHTFAFVDFGAEERMRQLSSQTGGQYRYIKSADERAAVKAVPAPAPVADADEAVGPPEVGGNSPADRVLAMAASLESRGRLRESLKAYRFILRKYPKTEAAAKARERIIQILKGTSG